MKKLTMTIKLFLIYLLISTVPSHAVLIGDYPGVTKLIDISDAIVILRIDRHITDYGSPTLYSTHECFICQSLKGSISKNTRINLQLMDTQVNFVTPYAWGAVHLMFLMKKQTENEPTEYRTLAYKGAHISLPPLGNEKTPEGKTIEEKIKYLIKKSISYQAKEHEKRQKFLESMLKK